jgi:16S rRNA (adenine1518-N6/adenine1519-N6)-dimethyltransferase
MLQKEVVERMNAKISTKQYNAFSILCQQLSSIETLFFVDRTLFLPAPDVDSLFIKITKNEKKYDEKFDKFIKLCFLQKRKTLINNLKPYFSIDKVREVLSKNNISSQVRAEELNLEKFIILCKELN